jgi:hypothetical protein
LVAFHLQGTCIRAEQQSLLQIRAERLLQLHLLHAAILPAPSAGARVALRNDSYALHILLPSKIDPLVSLMKVEKVPDSTYDMIGGCDQQIKEIKEVRDNCGSSSSSKRCSRQAAQMQQQITEIKEVRRCSSSNSRSSSFLCVLRQLRMMLPGCSRRSRRSRR